MKIRQEVSEQRKESFKDVIAVCVTAPPEIKSVIFKFLILHCPHHKIYESNQAILGFILVSKQRLNLHDSGILPSHRHSYK